MAGDDIVGAMTSAVHSPRLDRNIGFALMQSSHANGDMLLTVDTAEGIRNLEFTTMPFVDPDKSIPRQALR